MQFQHWEVAADEFEVSVCQSHFDLSLQQSGSEISISSKKALHKRNFQKLLLLICKLIIYIDCHFNVLKIFVEETLNCYYIDFAASLPSYVCDFVIF